MNRHVTRALHIIFVLVLALTFTTNAAAQGQTPSATPTASVAAPTPSPAPSATPLPATASPTPTVKSTPPKPPATPTLTPTAAVTQPVSGTSPLELTIYNQNIALVKSLRTITLTSGINLVQIDDIAAQIDPTSVYFVSLTDPTGTLVLEQNYEYDLVDAQKLLDKYTDQEITIRTING
ncbi:MAG: hypothetical protein ACYC6L_05000 [Anaerolineae bacterium]